MRFKVISSTGSLFNVYDTHLACTLYDHMRFQRADADRLAAGLNAQAAH